MKKQYRDKQNVKKKVHVSTKTPRQREGKIHAGGRHLRRATKRLEIRRAACPQKTGYRVAGSMKK